MLYYMFPYYGSECFSNKSHSSNKRFYIKKKTNLKLTRVQVMPKRNTFWNIHPQEDRSYLLIVLWPTCYCQDCEWRTKMFVWSAWVPSHPSLPSFFLFGQHDWTDEYVVLTAETVTQAQMTHSLLSYRRASRCFDQNTCKKRTGKKGRCSTKSEHLLSKIVLELVSCQSGHLTGENQCEHRCFVLWMTTYGFIFI